MKVLEELLILVLVVSLPKSCLASVMPKSPLENQLNLTEAENGTPQENVDPNQQQQMLQLGEVIVTAVEDLLDKQESAINNRLKQLEQYIDYSCGGTEGLVQNENEASSLEAAMSTVLNRFTRELSSVAQSFSENLRQELRQDTQQVLKRMEKQTSYLVTKSDIQQFQIQPKAVNKDKTMSLDDKKGSEQTTSSLSTIDKELELMNDQLADFKTYLGNVTPSDILDYSRRILKALENFLPLQDSLIDIASRGGCGPQEEEQTRLLDRLENLLQLLTEKVGENGESLSKVKMALRDNGNTLTDMLQDGLDRLLQGLTQDVDLISSGTPEESFVTTTQRTLSDCLDSKFVGSRYDLCATAVRYDKCYLQVVAYHCCRTCVDAGKIKEMGQHRYLNYPRTLNILE